MGQLLTSMPLLRHRCVPRLTHQRLLTACGAKSRAAAVTASSAGRNSQYQQEWPHRHNQKTKQTQSDWPHRHGQASGPSRQHSRENRVPAPDRQALPSDRLDDQEKPGSSGQDWPADRSAGVAPGDHANRNFFGGHRRQPDTAPQRHRRQQAPSRDDAWSSSPG